VRRISKHHKWLNIKVVATTVPTILATFGCMFKIIYAFAGNLTSTSDLDSNGTWLIVGAFLLGLLEIFIIRKKK
jgi:hypothetical protein